MCLPAICWGGIAGVALGASIGLLIGWVKQLNDRVAALEAGEAAAERIRAPAPAIPEADNVPEERPATSEPPTPDASPDPQRPPTEESARAPRATLGSDAGATGRISSATNRVTDFVKGWLTSGNVPVRVGVVLSLLGLAFFIREAIDRQLFNLPIVFRLVGVAAFGLGLLAVGWRLRERRRVYALSLQGGGVAVLYLTAYSAFALFDLLPAAAARIGAPGGTCAAAFGRRFICRPTGRICGRRGTVFQWVCAWSGPDCAGRLVLRLVARSGQRRGNQGTRACANQMAIAGVVDGVVAVGGTGGHRAISGASAIAGSGPRLRGTDHGSGCACRRETPVVEAQRRGIGIDARDAGRVPLVPGGRIPSFCGFRVAGVAVRTRGLLCVPAFSGASVPTDCRGIARARILGTRGAGCRRSTLVGRPTERWRVAVRGFYGGGRGVPARHASGARSRPMAPGAALGYLRGRLCGSNCVCPCRGSTCRQSVYVGRSIAVALCAGFQPFGIGHPLFADCAVALATCGSVVATRQSLWSAGRLGGRSLSAHNCARP